MKKKKFKKRQDWPTLVKDFQIASSLGFVIALPPVLGAFLGIFLDKILKTTPFLTLAFILLGTAGGLIAGIKTIKEII